MVNTFTMWTSEADRLQKTGGSFAYREFQNVTITDPTLAEYTFKNLREGFYYWIKYKVGSPLGWSVYSQPNRFYASKLPTKPMQPFGIAATTAALEISWSYDYDSKCKSDSRAPTVYSCSSNCLLYNIVKIFPHLASIILNSCDSDCER